MIIPYRTQQTLRRLGISLLSLAILLAVLLLCWFLWLQRYVVYTSDGVKLDFNISLEFAQGTVAQKPQTPVGDDIIFSEVSSLLDETSKELARFSGYRVTLDELKADLDAVKQDISALPKGTTIMLELKTKRGEFAYTTTLGPNVKGLDSVQVDELIAYLKTNGYYIIAQVPAFIEYEYFMYDSVNWSRNVNGLSRASGKSALWEDTSNRPCFWLNPGADGARSYLIQIISELRSLGFNEVAFSYFQFPDTDNIQFSGDRAATLAEAAEVLVNTCATETFAVSFIQTDVSLPLPQGRSRLYLTGVAAGDVTTLAGKVQFTDINAQLVFFADTNDTRFDEYSVLRPLDMAQ